MQQISKYISIKTITPMFMFALLSSLNADHTHPPHIYFSPPLDPAYSPKGFDYGFTAWMMFTADHKTDRGQPIDSRIILLM